MTYVYSGSQNCGKIKMAAIIANVEQSLTIPFIQGYNDEITKNNITKCPPKLLAVAQHVKNVTAKKN